MYFWLDTRQTNSAEDDVNAITLQSWSWYKVCYPLGIMNIFKFNSNPSNNRQDILPKTTTDDLMRAPE